MRKVIVLEFVFLDSVIHSQGGPDEDTSVGVQGDGEQNHSMGS